MFKMSHVVLFLFGAGELFPMVFWKFKVYPEFNFSRNNPLRWKHWLNFILTSKLSKLPQCFQVHRVTWCFKSKFLIRYPLILFTYTGVKCSKQQLFWIVSVICCPNMIGMRGHPSTTYYQTILLMDNHR